MQITGLDPSLTATGIARLAIATTGQHALEATTATSSGHRDDTLTERAHRLETLRDQIVHEALDADLVVIEGPAYAKHDAGTWDRAGLWWLITAWLHDVVPVALIPPTVLKRYATGRGNAPKPDMRMALYKRTGEDLADDNTVDAAWLAYAGAHHLGNPVLELPAAQVEALQRGEWPLNVSSAGPARRGAA